MRPAEGRKSSLEILKCEAQHTIPETKNKLQGESGYAFSKIPLSFCSGKAKLHQISALKITFALQFLNCIF